MANQKKLYGLTLRQSSAVNQVITLMDESPEGVSLKKLADRMLMHPSAASILVEKMVSKGLMERAENPKDRRTVLIRISNKGREIISNVHNHLLSEVGKLAARLSDEEQDQLIRIAAKIRETIQATRRA